MQLLLRAAAFALLLSAHVCHAAPSSWSSTKTAKKGGAGATQLSLVHIIADPLATCNDGTQSGYFMAQATSQENQFDWLVYLQGGDWCYSEDTCAQVHLGSTRPSPRPRAPPRRSNTTRTPSLSFSDSASTRRPRI
jgi:Pectinacetylesterase